MVEALIFSYFTYKGIWRIIDSPIERINHKTDEMMCSNTLLALNQPNVDFISLLREWRQKLTLNEGPDVVPLIYVPRGEDASAICCAKCLSLGKRCSLVVELVEKRTGRDG